MTNSRTIPSGPPSRLGPTIALASCALGVAQSVAITALKFRSDHGCDATALNACGGLLSGGAADLFACEVVLTSRYSELVGLPVTVFAAVAYLLGAGLGVAVLVRPASATARVMLFALAVAVVVVSGVMFAISAWLLDSWCLHCFALYGCAAAFSLGAGLSVCVWGVGGALRLGRRDLLRAGGRLVLTGLALVWAHAVVLTRLGASTDDCRYPVSSVPDTLLVFGDPDPEVVVGLFYDPSCTACAAELAWLREYVAASPIRVEVRMFHDPRESDACGLAGARVRRPNQGSTAAEACGTAFFVECVAALPGAGGAAAIELLGHAFELLAAPMGPYDRLRALYSGAARLGLVPPSSRYDGSALEACVRTRDAGPAVDRLVAHLRFADRLDVRATPTALVAPVRGGQVLWGEARRLDGRGERRMQHVIVLASRTEGRR